MSYTTQADLSTRFGQRELVELTDEAGTGVIDATVVARAIADADEEIDSYLRRRLSLPLAYVPGVLGRIAADIARYYLWDDRARDEGIGKTVAARYDQAIKFLESVAAGRVDLGVSADGGAATTPVASQAEAWTTPRRIARGRV